MLALRRHQLHPLDQYQEWQFRETLRGHIQQEYPAYAEVSPPTLMRLLGFPVARAGRYGFTWQSNLGQFVYLMAAIVPNFD